MVVYTTRCAPESDRVGSFGGAGGRKVRGYNIGLSVRLAREQVKRDLITIAGQRSYERQKKKKVIDLPTRKRYYYQSHDVYFPLVSFVNFVFLFLIVLKRAFEFTASVM